MESSSDDPLGNVSDSLIVETMSEHSSTTELLPSHSASNTGVYPSHSASNTGVYPSHSASNTGVYPSHSPATTKQREGSLILGNKQNKEVISHTPSIASTTHSENTAELKESDNLKQASSPTDQKNTSSQPTGGSPTSVTNVKTISLLSQNFVTERKDIRPGRLLVTNKGYILLTGKKPNDETSKICDNKIQIGNVTNSESEGKAVTVMMTGTQVINYKKNLPITVQSSSNLTNVGLYSQSDPIHFLNKNKVVHVHKCQSSTSPPRIVKIDGPLAKSNLIFTTQVQSRNDSSKATGKKQLYVKTVSQKGSDVSENSTSSSSKPGIDIPFTMSEINTMTSERIESVSSSVDLEHPNPLSASVTTISQGPTTTLITAHMNSSPRIVKIDGQLAKSNLIFTTQVPSDNKSSRVTGEEQLYVKTISQIGSGALSANNATNISKPEIAIPFKRSGAVSGTNIMTAGTIECGSSSVNREHFKPSVIKVSKCFTTNQAAHMNPVTNVKPVIVSKYLLNSGIFPHTVSTNDASHLIRVIGKDGAQKNIFIKPSEHCRFIMPKLVSPPNLLPLVKATSAPTKIVIHPTVTPSASVLSKGTSFTLSRSNMASLTSVGSPSHDTTTPNFKPFKTILGCSQLLSSVIQKINAPQTVPNPKVIPTKENNLSLNDTSISEKETDDTSTVIPRAVTIPEAQKVFLVSKRKSSTAPVHMKSLLKGSSNEKVPFGRTPLSVSSKCMIQQRENSLFSTSVQTPQGAIPVMVVTPNIDDNNESDSETELGNLVEDDINWVSQTIHKAVRSHKRETAARQDREDSVSQLSAEHINHRQPPYQRSIGTQQDIMREDFFQPLTETNKCAVGRGVESNDSFGIRIESVFSLTGNCEFQEVTDDGHSLHIKDGQSTGNGDVNAKEHLENAKNKLELENLVFDLKETLDWKNYCLPCYTVLERLSKSDIVARKQSDAVPICSHHCRKRHLDNLCSLNLLSCDYHPDITMYIGSKKKKSSKRETLLPTLFREPTKKNPQHQALMSTCSSLNNVCHLNDQIVEIIDEVETSIVRSNHSTSSTADLGKDDISSEPIVLCKELQRSNELAPQSSSTSHNMNTIKKSVLKLKDSLDTKHELNKEVHQNNDRVKTMVKVRSLLETLQPLPEPMTRSTDTWIEPGKEESVLETPLPEPVIRSNDAESVLEKPLSEPITRSTDAESVLETPVSEPMTGSTEAWIEPVKEGSVLESPQTLPETMTRSIDISIEPGKRSVLPKIKLQCIDSQTTDKEYICHIGTSADAQNQLPGSQAVFKNVLSQKEPVKKTSNEVIRSLLNRSGNTSLHPVEKESASSNGKEQPFFKEVQDLKRQIVFKRNLMRIEKMIRKGRSARSKLQPKGSQPKKRTVTIVDHRGNLNGQYPVSKNRPLRLKSLLPPLMQATKSPAAITQQSRSDCTTLHPVTLVKSLGSTISVSNVTKKSSTELSQEKLQSALNSLSQHLVSTGKNITQGDSGHFLLKIDEKYFFVKFPDNFLGSTATTTTPTSTGNKIENMPLRKVVTSNVLTTKQGESTEPKLSILSSTQQKSNSGLKLTIPGEIMNSLPAKKTTNVIQEQTTMPYPYRTDLFDSAVSAILSQTSSKSSGHSLIQTESRTKSVVAKSSLEQSIVSLNVVSSSHVLEQAAGTSHEHQDKLPIQTSSLFSLPQIRVIHADTQSDVAITNTQSMFSKKTYADPNSRLSHLPPNSTLLPQRRKRDATETEEEKLLKRRKLEIRYPLPPGIIIKSEPDCLEFELDENWSVTSECSSRNYTEGAVGVSYTEKTAQQSYDEQVHEGCTHAHSDNDTLDNNALHEYDTSDDNDEPPSLIEQPTSKSQMKSKQVTVTDFDEPPPVLQPMFTPTSSSLASVISEDSESQDDVSMVSDLHEVQPSSSSTTVHQQRLTACSDSGHETDSSASSSVSSLQHSSSSNFRPTSFSKSDTSSMSFKNKKIQRLKELLKKKEIEIENMRKIRSELPSLDIDNV